MTAIAFYAHVDASIVHGGGTDDSNVIMFRRESVLVDGHPTRVPVVSGNSLRGVLRRHGAWLLADLLGWRDNPPKASVVRVVSSGGALRQESALPVDLANEARRVPHLGLFGGSWAGEIHPGSLVVDKLLPICAETQGLTQVASDVPAGRLLDLEQFTRHDSSPIVPADTDPDEVDDSTQMIYQAETLSAGVTLAGGFRLRPWASDAEADWLMACLRAFIESGGHIGGRSATGHGRIRLPVSLADETAADRAKVEVTDNLERYRRVFDAM